MSGGDGKPSGVPRDVLVIQSILKDAGVTDYEPAVIPQLLDFTYRYVTDILDDAKAFSSHAGKKSLDVEDTKLAVQLKLDKSYTNPPPRELLLDIASHRNSQSLPVIKPYTGPKLPPDRYCLSSMNYQLKTHRKPTLSYTLPGMRQQRMPKQTTVSLARSNSMQGATRTSKAQPGTRQPSIVSSSSSQLTAQAFASALSTPNATVQVKRKLEPDDDYDT
ncbi:transcription initiation factor TFIID subunit 9-like [Watersipora subatra]|uniref:transcription initiation factor TFIID subunit 9-like n=1 Tax=Watersipora subatra TaxID=2589382 RepID=UPI00355B013F